MPTGVNVDPANFMSDLDNGVILCQLIAVIQAKQANKLKVNNSCVMNKLNLLRAPI